MNIVELTIDCLVTAPRSTNCHAECFFMGFPINASGVAVGSLSAIQHGMPRASAGVPLRTLG